LQDGLQRVAPEVKEAMSKALRSPSVADDVGVYRLGRTQIDSKALGKDA
jgi:hypothetical protein